MKLTLVLAGLVLLCCSFIYAQKVTIRTNAPGQGDIRIGGGEGGITVRPITASGAGSGGGSGSVTNGDALLIQDNSFFLIQDGGKLLF